MKKLLLTIIALSLIAALFAESDSLWIKKIEVNDKIYSNPPGVNHYDSARTSPGVNFIYYDDRSSVLVDLYGHVLKQISLGFANFLSDGSIVGKASDSVLVRIDADLNIIWTKTIDGRIHHEISVDDKNNIYLLASHDHDFLGVKMRFDVVEIYSENGKAIFSWCLFTHLKDFLAVISKSLWCNDLPLSFDSSISAENYILQDVGRFFSLSSADEGGWEPEFAHFNTIQPLNNNTVTKSIPAFKKGNLLLSFNPYSCYGILNPATSKIEWAGYLPERTTLHTPSLTPQGTILVFQNSTDAEAWADSETYAILHQFFAEKKWTCLPFNVSRERAWASASEYNPVNNQKVWEYTGTPKESIIDGGRGSAYRLLNGNTLISLCCPSNGAGGRIFEVTPDKSTVWDYSSDGLDYSTTSRAVYRANRLNSVLIKNFIKGFKQ